MSSRSLWAALNPGSPETSPKIGLTPTTMHTQNSANTTTAIRSAVRLRISAAAASISVAAPAYHPRTCMNAARSSCVGRPQ